MPHAHVPAVFRALGVHIVTVSTSRDARSDKSGPLLVELAAGAGHRIAGHARVVDDPEAIAAVVDAALADPVVEVVILTGGTGISARDCTSRVVGARLDRVLPGFGELFRMLSWQEVGAAAMLSTAVGGIASGKPVFALPGSVAACRLAMERLILPELGHLTAELAKESPLSPPTWGWRAAVAALSARLAGPASLPEGLPAALVDILAEGTLGRLESADGPWLLVGFPDLARATSKVLAVRADGEDWEVLALHRYPRRVGRSGRSRWVGENALLESLARTGAAAGPSLWASDSSAVYVREGAEVVRWDGRQRTSVGTPAQALASVVLGWSQR